MRALILAFIPTLLLCRMAHADEPFEFKGIVVGEKSDPAKIAQIIEVAPTAHLIHVHIAEKGDYYEIAYGLPKNQHWGAPL